MAVQFAAKMGMEVTAFTTSMKERAAEFKDLGAHSTSHSTDLEQLAKEEGKYHLVVNTLFVSDEKVYKAHQRLVRPGGTIVILGVPDAKVELVLDLPYIMSNNIRVAGSLIGSAKDVEDMLKFCSNYGVAPLCEQMGF